MDGAPGLKVLVPANATKTQRLFVTAPAHSLGAEAARTDLRLWIQDLGTEAVPSNDRVHHDTVFNGKGE